MYFGGRAVPGDFPVRRWLVPILLAALQAKQNYKSIREINQSRYTNLAIDVGWLIIASLSKDVFKWYTSTWSGPLAFLGNAFAQIFWQIFPMRIKALFSKKNFVASRHVNGKIASLPVDVHDSKRFCLSYRITLCRYVSVLYITYRIFEILNNWPFGVKKMQWNLFPVKWPAIIWQ